MKIVVSDAYRALLRTKETYDLIVSEPSNPWVAGVEMLYSQEFLEAARDRLAPGGVYAQWIHLYENDSRALELVLRTYDSVFDATAVWSTMHTDLLILGLKDGATALDVARLAERAARPDFAAGLRRAKVESCPRCSRTRSCPQGVLRALQPARPRPHAPAPAPQRSRGPRLLPRRERRDAVHRLRRRGAGGPRELAAPALDRGEREEGAHRRRSRSGGDASLHEPLAALRAVAGRVARRLARLEERRPLRARAGALRNALGRSHQRARRGAARSCSRRHRRPRRRSPARASRTGSTTATTATRRRSRPTASRRSGSAAPRTARASAPRAAGACRSSCSRASARRWRSTRRRGERGGRESRTRLSEFSENP